MGAGQAIPSPWAQGWVLQGGLLRASKGAGWRGGTAVLPNLSSAGGHRKWVAAPPPSNILGRQHPAPTVP